MYMAVQSAQAGVDAIGTGDDVGTQRGMLMSPDTWRRWLKPRWAKVIAAAKAVKPDLLVTYHSDGDISTIIPELAEIGIDVLNPVQPECLDVAEVKRLYGDRLAFFGGMGIQTTMPFGTPEDVRAEVHRLIRILGAGGGFLIAPTHVLEPEVPWENIRAFFDAVEEYGTYA
jgi:uroporphyrinogen decarboxylase